MAVQRTQAGKKGSPRALSGTQKHMPYWGMVTQENNRYHATPLLSWTLLCARSPPVLDSPPYNTSLPARPDACVQPPAAHTTLAARRRPVRAGLIARPRLAS